MKLLLNIGPILFIFFSQSAFAYPNFVGYGYKSCVTCHYNPLGNGPLTDYGRAVSASVIAAKPFFVSRMTTDEKLADASGFLGRLEMPSWFRPSVGVRGLILTQNLQKSPKTQYIQMQLDGSLVLKTSNDRFFGVFNLGYIPTALGATGTSNLISREHYLGFRFSKEWGVYAGLMDIAYGLRVADHVAYSRVYTFLAQNDQTHGVLLHSLQKTWELGVHAILGNLFQDPTVQLRGASATAEFDIATNFRAGLSLMAVNSTYRIRRLGSVHTRMGLSEGSSVLMEAGMIAETTVVSDSTISPFVFFQGTQRLGRGANFLFNLEYYSSSSSVSPSQKFRVGPGFQYFPMQRFEFRIDLTATRLMGNSSVNSDTFNLLSQFHIWL